MVFAQILVLQSKRTLYNVGIHGRVKVKVLGIAYNYDAGTDSVISIKSDALSINYGTNRHLIFSNASVGMNSWRLFDGVEFECNLIGQIDIELYDVISNGSPAGFTKDLSSNVNADIVAESHMIIHLDITKLD